MATSRTSAVVEGSVHDELRRMVQAIWNEHGICVKSVQFSWLNVSAVGKIDMLATDVETEILTKLEVK